MDVHRFCEGDHLYLGGVKIPHQFGLEAHSDGDVLLHALCDALLGAAAMGDIGKHFPDTDARYQNINSRKLLRLVMSKLADAKFAVSNASIVVVAQAPKLAPYILAMCENVCADLNVASDAVNVAATTSEYLGFTGRKEGIAAFATVVLAKLEDR